MIMKDNIYLFHFYQIWYLFSPFLTISWNYFSNSDLFKKEAKRGFGFSIERVNSIMEQLEQLKISIQNRVDQYKQEKSNDSIVLSSIFKTMIGYYYWDIINI